jgi:hypothetical protein
MVLVTATAHAQIVQYEAELRFGFGSNSAGTPGNPAGSGNMLDTANNAIPPCAATNANPPTTAKPAWTGGTGAVTGFQNFQGIASIIPATGTATKPSVKFFQVTAWNGVATSCPVFTNGTPGGGLFARTQMAQFAWPQADGTVSENGAPGTFAANIPWAALGEQKLGMFDGPNKYGGAAAMIGSGNTRLGIFGLGGTRFVGSLPIPISLGIATKTSQPVGTTMNVTAFFVQVTDPVNMTGTFTTTMGAFTGTAQGMGASWGTGTISAYDTFGDFTTTRIRIGSAYTAVAGTGPTTAHLQLVTPSVLKLGIPAVGGVFGIATTAVLEINFVPEPGATAMLVAGVGMLGGLYYRRKA